MTEKWMREGTARTTHGFLEIDLLAGFERIEPAAGCSRFLVSDLHEDNQAERCLPCMRTIRRLRASASRAPAHSNASQTEAQDRIASALGLLTADQWEITAVPGMVTATRHWTDRSRDTLMVLSPDNSHARRDDHAGMLVWRTRGCVEDVAKAAQNLVPPGSPGAPRDPIGPV